MRAAALAGCLALSGSALLSCAGARDAQTIEDPAEPPREDPGQHLGVIVPVYEGDLSRAVSSLERWPSRCSSVTERNADLVLYYAEGEEHAPAVTTAVETIRKTAGHCFAETRLVYAHLSEEEDVYPKGPSVMFFKMFLDEGVHAALSEYDALAIVEWDVLVASDRSFEELHNAAFRGNEDFWVKGSNLGGTNFHSSAQATDMWKVLGHINGNALYNNNDPAFVEYVDYTRTRWEYVYPYDVALWLTISDFPYSWPLWQRYSSKFVTTNLISYVGYEHVDHSTVSDAVAGQTLFIHGSRVDEGNLASLDATKDERLQAFASGRRLSDDTETPPPACNAACGIDVAGLPVGTSTVCDDTCDGKSARFDGLLCGAGDSDRFGPMCRLCYVDVEEARRQEQSLALMRSDVEGGHEASHVIMCDTMRPPEAAECSDKCGLKKDTVCDESCGTGRYGDYNCNWRDHGPKCRFCFDNLDTALMADQVAQRRGGRVIMCSTFEPPLATPKSDVMHIVSPTMKHVTTAVVHVEPPRTSPSRTLQANTCDAAECPHENSNGFRGRLCDPTCADGIPNGTNGCGAREGRFGDLCRVCYFDVERALANDSPGDRAIMCTTGLPVDLEEPNNTCDVEDCPHVNSNGFRGRICDPTCADGIPNGMNGCDAREGRFGNLCRVCFFDVERALANDAPGDRAIMCTTGLPVDPDDAAPATCDVDDCPRINSNGLRGRFCDPTCADGIPNGTNGCGAREGRFGSLCRLCFVDMERALENDDPVNRAIMCDTMLPVDVYRRLSAVVADSPRIMSAPDVADVDDAQSVFADATILPYVNDLVRGNLCAFIAGDVNEVDKVEVAVMSVLQFLPGMTVAVATDNTGFHAYQRAVGVLPGVTVHSTEDPFAASLFADKYCGVNTNLIFYMKTDSVVSRPFTSKDTHSSHGDLLVVHGSGKVAYYDRELAKQTAAVLGFQSPSFTFNTDLFLPVGANADLREVLVSGRDNEERERHEGALEALQSFMTMRNMSAVPQLMAALAYSRNTPGVWFVDPQAWVSQHLFRTASIWEIPLVKPRYTCSIDLLAMKSNADEIDVALVLQSNLDYFAQGGTCDSGYIDIRRGG